MLEGFEGFRRDFRHVYDRSRPCVDDERILSDSATNPLEEELTLCDRSTRSLGTQSQLNKTPRRALALPRQVARSIIANRAPPSRRLLFCTESVAFYGELADVAERFGPGIGVTRPPPRRAKQDRGSPLA